MFYIVLSDTAKTFGQASVFSQNQLEEKKSCIPSNFLGSIEP